MKSQSKTCSLSYKLYYIHLIKGLAKSLFLVENNARFVHKFCCVFVHAIAKLHVQCLKDTEAHALVNIWTGNERGAGN